MRVAVSGASGLVGTALTAALEAGGHETVRIVRRRPAGAAEIEWDPVRGETDPERWAGLDAVVNLSGEGIASGRWTGARKMEILDSRVDCTRLAASTLASLDPRPRVLVNASAIGYYGDRGDRAVDEDSGPGEGFLAGVCKAWEEAARPAMDAGIRTVLLRIGVVLSRDGGALASMLTPFRLGLGGRIGSGRQYMSWISLTDLAAVIVEAIGNERLTGPVNAVSPGAVDNAGFTRTLGRVLGRWTPLPVPGGLLRMVMGEMAGELLLGGAHVHPQRLLSAGFRFRHPELEGALRDELLPPAV